MRFCHAVRKKLNIVRFSTRAANHPRGFRMYGNDTWILKRLDNMAPARVPARLHPRGLDLTNRNGPLLDCFKGIIDRYSKLLDRYNGMPDR